MVDWHTPSTVNVTDTLDITTTAQFTVLVDALECLLTIGDPIVPNSIKSIVRAINK